MKLFHDTLEYAARVYDAKATGDLLGPKTQSRNIGAIDGMVEALPMNWSLDFLPDIYKARASGIMGAFDGQYNDLLMRPKSEFITDDFYYCTILHEATHWTGGPRQLNRALDNNAEEFIAEIVSLTMATHYKLDLPDFWRQRPQHYVLVLGKERVEELFPLAVEAYNFLHGMLNS